MKKAIALLASLILLTICTAPAALAGSAPEARTYSCTVLQHMNADALTWTSGEETRAMFTILALLEYCLATGAQSGDVWSVTSPSYVLRAGLEVGAFYQTTNGTWLCIYYNPTTSPERFSVTTITNRLTNSQMRTALGRTADYYWENNAVTLYRVTQELADVLNN